MNSDNHVWNFDSAWQFQKENISKQLTKEEISVLSIQSGDG